MGGQLQCLGFEVLQRRHTTYVTDRLVGLRKA
jgi:hypothetical protein